MSFEDYAYEQMQRDFAEQCYTESGKEDRIEMFDDYDLAHAILLDLFDDPFEWFVVGLNYRTLSCLQWFVDTGYAQVGFQLGVAKITQSGIRYLEDITS